jgi:putative protease
MDPELLLPVGDMNMALAAIHNGADAIYVGVPGFNARGRAKDFSREELKELIDLCHVYGVKVHLAFNVLVFEDELSEAAELLADILPLGADAFIVQDLGLVRLIRAMAPHQRIHGSTQMTVTNDEAIRLLEDLNIQRFVLGRENSLPEIQLIRQHTPRELEVFVHGALCVAYSGQCFTSESLGGRSANRGQCAQSCRLDYELWVDGEKRDLGDKKYLVSPQDLCGVEEIPRLMEIGVNSFKVEGRLKTPEYVATAAKGYRAAIRGEKVDVTDMATSFGRGFFNGWLGGVDHQRLVEGTFSAHRGLEIGAVRRSSSDAVWLEGETVPVAGQGLMFSNGKGAKVLSAVRGEDGIRVRLLAPFDHAAVPVGARSWINSDDRVARETRLSVEDRQQMKRVPLTAKLRIVPGDAVRLEARDPQGRVVTIEHGVGVAALKVPTTLADATAELGALGTTAFRLDELVLENRHGYVSQKDLKHLRRQMVEQMLVARTTMSAAPVLDGVGALAQLRASPAAAVAPRLNVVLRDKGQVEDLVAGLAPSAQLGIVFLDFEFGKDYAPSVALLRQHGFTSGIATTRVLKPREYHNLNIIERAAPDAVLVRNLGALQWFQGKSFRLVGDFSLNAANSASVDYLLSKGLETVCASYDLNERQLTALLSNSPRDRVEVTLHQYMPEFHMEHCVFAAFMSKGSSFRDCGKPCEKHQVELKDAYGHMHFLKADQECRNTMYRGSAQSAAYLVGRENSPGTWRFEALQERGETLLAKLTAYLGLLGGESELAQVVRSVGASEKYGVTEGQLAHAHAWKDRKKVTEAGR